MKQFLEEERMLQFPVFQLHGGSAVERLACIDAIQNDSRFAHLDIGVAKEGQYLPHDVYLKNRHFDLVLVDGYVDFPLHKINIGSEICSTSEDLLFQTVETYEWNQFCDGLLRKINFLAGKVPVSACILIGGKSSRMGQPKHLLQGIDGTKESWIERTIRLVKPLVDGVVISGKGVIPESLADVARIPDIPGVAGPLTGVLSAMRWQPHISWLVIACDMPFISKKSVEWLLSERQAGSWGRLPRIAGADFCEPLFAWYDGRAGYLLEEQLLTGNLRVGKIASHHKIDNPIIPDSLASAWQNVNTPEQLQSVQLS